MSTQMKLIIPLLDEEICKEDISTDCGFVDGYITDINKPGNDDCIFLMYDCENKSINAYNRTNKFCKLKSLKSSRIIRVNNHPYILYTFTITNPDVRRFKKGLSWKSYKSFNKISSFWDPNEKDVFDALMWEWKPYEKSDKSVPEEDYSENICETMCFEECAITA